ncbi:MAG: LacI family DNA-binding transcriptional regulator [Capsulimonadaceae bacterium]|nr:LacI family DNA-binding transcriptional regulator [Capsulimonadaceae bacterium]
MTTITDIANECGTSITTVSKVLNGNDRKIGSATKARVNEAIARLGYKPNAAARGLRKQRANCIGICMRAHQVSTEYFAMIIDALLDEAARLGQGLMLFSSSPGRQDDPQRLMFADGRCDGLLFLSEPDTRVVEALNRVGVPAVALHDGALPSGASSIDVDNVQIGYDTTKYLLGLGHRKIVFLNTSTDRPYGEQRCQGYRRAMTEAALKAVSFGDRAHAVDAYEFALQIADNPQQVTAIITVTDNAALRVLLAFAARGMRVPEDMSVVGIDGLFAGEISVPPLTTMSQRPRELAIAAMRALLDRIEHPGLPAAHVKWEAQLVVRASAGPPRKVS